MSVNYGAKRIVVGAHYGLRDWLAQRVTAALIALFTLVLLLQVVLGRGEIGYDKWAGIFSSQWMKALTFAVILALIYHAWIGLRDITPCPGPEAVQIPTRAPTSWMGSQPPIG
mgnify:CR=1 FL=1